MPPDERPRHRGLQELRAKRRTAVRRLRTLLAEARNAYYEIEAEQLAYADYVRSVQAGHRQPDPELESRLRADVRRTAPNDIGDPRLAGWYHTVELGEGLRSAGRFDLRSCVDQHGLPKSLVGKTALDVGTCDGFWAVEFERRGADRVVAADIEFMGDFDYLPEVREALRRRLSAPSTWFSAAACCCICRTP